MEAKVLWEGEMATRIITVNSVVHDRLSPSSLFLREYSGRLTISQFTACLSQFLLPSYNLSLRDLSTHVRGSPWFNWARADASSQTDVYSGSPLGGHFQTLRWQIGISYRKRNSLSQ